MSTHTRTIPAALAAIILASPALAAAPLVPVGYQDELGDRPARIVAPKDADFEPTAEGLAGKRLGVQIGTLHHCIGERLFPAARLMLFDSQEQGFADLAAGRVDVLLADAVLAYERFLSQEAGRDFAFLGNEQFERSCHGDDDDLAEGGEAPKSLLQRLDDALKKMRDDGTLEALGDKHFKSVPAGQE